MMKRILCFLAVCLMASLMMGILGAAAEQALPCIGECPVLPEPTAFLESVHRLYREERAEKGVRTKLTYGYTGEDPQALLGDALQEYMHQLRLLGFTVKNYEISAGGTKLAEIRMTGNFLRSNLIEICIMPGSENMTAAPAPLTEEELAALGSSAIYDPLEPGDDCRAVLDARQKLYELGYFKSAPTQTEYTNGMRDYVKKFEKDYGLTEDGILSPDDQALLFSL